MSRPRGRRMNTGMSAFRRTCWNFSRDPVWSAIRDVGPGIEGDQVHLGADAVKQADHFVGVLGSVVDFSSSTYSKVRRSRLRRGNVRAAPSSFSRSHLRLRGMTDSRTSSFDPLSEMASLGGSVRGRIFDAWNDSGGRDGHARFGNADFLTSRRTDFMKFS